MMSQAWGHMDVAPEPLGNFDWSLRPVLNACNFAGASWYFGLQRINEAKAAHWHPCHHGICESIHIRLQSSLPDSLPRCGMEFHDFRPNEVWTGMSPLVISNTSSNVQSYKSATRHQKGKDKR